MADYDAVRRTIDNNIYANGEQRITGEILNDVLNAMVDADDEQVSQLNEEVNANKDNINNLQQEIDSIQPIIIEGNVTNAPDEEDITTDANNLLKFANRSTAVNQMGYVILRKNKNLAEQLTQTNTIYEIRYEFTLDEDITIPENCVLKFNGGSIKGNGINTITGNKTKISAGKIKIFDNIINGGGFVGFEVFPQWFGAIADGITDCSDAIQAAIDFAANNAIPGNPWDILGPKNSLKIKLVAGEYLISKSIYAKSYTNIDGEGRGISKIINDNINDGSPMIWFGYRENDTNHKIHNATLKNFSINGKDKNCIGIYAVDQYSFIENIWITNCKTYGLYLWESWCTYINRCNFIYNAIDNPDGYSIYMSGRESGWGCNAVTIDTCEFNGRIIEEDNQRTYKGNAIYTNYGNGIRIVNSNFQSSDKVITIGGSTASLTILNCYFEQNNYAITGSAININIMNCHIYHTVCGACIKSDTCVRVNFINNNPNGNFLVDWLTDDGTHQYSASLFMGCYGATKDNAFPSRVLSQIAQLNTFSYILNDNTTAGAFIKAIFSRTGSGTLANEINSQMWSKPTEFMRVNGWKPSDAPDDRFYNYFVVPIKADVSHNLVFAIPEHSVYNDDSIYVGLYYNNGTTRKITAWTRINYRNAGTFADKPTNAKVGDMYFCTDKQTTEGGNNGIMIYYNGTTWVDALGRVVS